MKRIQLPPRKYRIFIAVAGVVVFGSLGLYLTLQSSAATVTITREAESGVLAGNSSALDQTGASGGKAIKFDSTGGNPGPGPGPGGPITQPTWSDEFNGTAISWASDTGGGSWRTKGYEAGGSLNNGYNDFVARSWNASLPQIKQHNLATIGNGILTLTAKRTNTLPGFDAQGAAWTGPYLVSNHLTNLAWRYGYFEIRMRAPNPVRGMFPTLWMFNNVADRHDGYEGAEMNMIEIFGDRRGYPWYAGIHFNPSKLNGAEGRNIATVSTDTSSWHRYAIEWTPTKITYSRDGQTVGMAEGAEAAWFSHANMGFRMNYSMDPEWDIQGDLLSTPTDPAPGTEPRMEIDYARYYAQKPANMPAGTDDPHQ